MTTYYRPKTENINKKVPKKPQKYDIISTKKKVKNNKNYFKITV